MTFKIEMRDALKLEKALIDVKEKAFPYAVRETLNTMAFKAQGVAQGTVSRDFTLRNTFTKRSFRVEKVDTLNVDQMRSRMGTVAHYMENVEQGGVRRNRAGETSGWVTSSFASGEEGANPRKRVPKRSNLLKNIELSKVSLQTHENSASLAVPTRRGKKGRTGVAVKRIAKPVNKGHANRILIKAVAASSGSKYVYLETKTRKGIFKVIGPKENPKVKLMYDLSKKAMKIKAHPVVQPAANYARLHGPEIYYDALRYQFRRLGLPSS